jgi:hypothetical protein
MKAIFERVPPGVNFKGKQTESLPVGWFAVTHLLIDNKKERREAYGTLYRIKSANGSVYRFLRFSPRLKGSLNKVESQMLIDWNAWLDLTGRNEYVSENIVLEIRKANWIEIFFQSTTFPDPTYRHAMQISRIGLYLGIISLVLAFK